VIHTPSDTTTLHESSPSIHPARNPNPRHSSSSFHTRPLVRQNGKPTNPSERTARAISFCIPHENHGPPPSRSPAPACPSQLPSITPGLTYSSRPVCRQACIPGELRHHHGLHDRARRFTASTRRSRDCDSEESGGGSRGPARECTTLEHKSCGRWGEQQYDVEYV
jgi:hypothetical protein